MATSDDLIEAYESGYLDTPQTLELFAEFLHTGTIWHLRYPLRRTADNLIAAGYLTAEGKITNEGWALILDEGREGSPCDANPEIDGVSDEAIPGPFAGPNV